MRAVPDGRRAAGGARGERHHGPGRGAGRDGDQGSLGRVVARGRGEVGRPERVSARAALSQDGRGSPGAETDNLLANALEAGRRRAARSRSVRSRPDAGSGSSCPTTGRVWPQQQRAAFRRYVSATPGGTGLGLAIVHRIVTSDGGTAELSETPGGGLTVTLDVPGRPGATVSRADRDSPRPRAAIFSFSEI